MRDFFYLLFEIAVIISCIASGQLLKKKRPEKTVKIFIPIREYKLYYISALIFFLGVILELKKFFMPILLR